jgi:hypothetical protein
MTLHAATRLGVWVVAGLGILCTMPVSGEAGGIPPGQNTPPYHPSAVKGQTIALSISAPPEFRRMSFKMQGLPAMLDTEAPFGFTILTHKLQPAHYIWHSSAYEQNCCNFQGNGGSIQIYPLPKVRSPKLSALVVAGTAKVVGLVVSREAKNRVVRAWSFSRPKTEDSIFRIPLRLQRRHRLKRIYRFAHGFTVNAGAKTEIDVEVAPAKRTLRHGVEVRGRLARLVLKRDRRTGETRAHRIEKTPCTTISARKGFGPKPLPTPQSCKLAPAEPAVKISCVKLAGCALASDRPPESG